LLIHSGTGRHPAHAATSKQIHDVSIGYLIACGAGFRRPARPRTMLTTCGRSNFVQAG